MASVLGLLALVALRRSGLALWLLLIAATQWLPWLFNARESYSFYEASLIPVLLVAAGVVAARGRGRAWTVATVVVVGSAVGLAVLFYPIWTGLPLTSRAALFRLWLRGWQ
jgi:dolichyl-phosphate-mannose--protein O-mannosyl transferase